GLVELIAAAAEEGRAAQEERLAERVRELRTALQADETAVAQEIVRMAARSDISEEVSRFRGHVSHWAILTDGPDACGRKLDFLLQEMNREVNTMGSKADGLGVSELIISAKAELGSRRGSRSATCSSGRTSSATATGPRRPIPSACSKPAATWCWSSTCRARARCGAAAWRRARCS